LASTRASAACCTKIAASTFVRVAAKRAGDRLLAAARHASRLAGVFHPFGELPDHLLIACPGRRQLTLRLDAGGDGALHARLRLGHVGPRGLAHFEAVARRLQLPPQHPLVVLRQRQDGLGAPDVHIGGHNAVHDALLDGGEERALRLHVLLRRPHLRIGPAARVERLHQVEARVQGHGAVVAPRGAIVAVRILQPGARVHLDVGTPARARLRHAFIYAAQLGAGRAQRRVVRVGHDERVVQRLRACVSGRQKQPGSKRGGRHAAIKNGPVRHVLPLCLSFPASVARLPAKTRSIARHGRIDGLSPSQDPAGNI
jgi:hypothetical protein